MAAKGYVVLYPNPRGSTSYGQEFGNVIQYHYPGDDYKDLMLGVDETIKRGYVDAKKLGVTGGSGGGLLTNWVVGHTDRFAAAVSQRDIASWTDWWYTADFTLFQPTWFKAPPFRGPGRFQGALADHLHQRGEDADRCSSWAKPTTRTPPGAGGEQMFRALKFRKIPTVMVKFPNETHELSRSGEPGIGSNGLQHIVGWFDRWLMGVAKPEYDVAPERGAGETECSAEEAEAADVIKWSRHALVPVRKASFRSQRPEGRPSPMGKERIVACRSSAANAEYLPMRLRSQNYHDIERIIEFDFVRATEAAALNSLCLAWARRKRKGRRGGVRRDARDVRSHEHLRRSRDRRRDQGRRARHFQRRTTWDLAARFAAVRYRARPDRWHDQHLQRRAELDQLHRGGEPGEGVKVALRDIPSFYMMKLAYGAARDSAHAEKRESICSSSRARSRRRCSGRGASTEQTRPGCRS